VGHGDEDRGRSHRRHVVGHRARDRRWAHVDLDAAPVKDLVVELAKRGVFFDPTLSIDEYDTLFLYDVEADHVNNRYLSREFVAANLGPDHDIFRIPAAMRAAAADGLTKRKRFVSMSYRAGVTVVAGTDGPGIGRLAPGFGLHRELELLVEVGLTPLDALRAATINAAHSLHREQILGTIEVGKYADLVILRGNPLDDIKNAAGVDAVVAAGRFFDRAALAELLRRLEELARSGE
jgi:Amidohydrolase family